MVRRPTIRAEVSTGEEEAACSELATVALVGPATPQSHAAVLPGEFHAMKEHVLADTPLRTLHRELRGRRVFASAIVEKCVDQYSTRGAVDHAYALWTGEKARALAGTIDALLSLGADAGPLMGIPLSVKDIFGVPGLPTHAGLAAPLPNEWEAAGPVMAATLRQLASLMGKSHTVPFAFGGLGTSTMLGTPRNPWDTEAHRAPGGSSSGAGVSIASGTARLAFGTDTHGSVRVPASMTGVAGLKITAGRWPAKGIVPLSTTLDTPGLLALTADDLAFAFESLDPDLTGRRETAPVIPDVSDLVLGVARSFFWDDCSPGIGEAVWEAIIVLKDAGARLIDRDLPGCSEAFHVFRQGGVAASELAAFLEDRLPGTRQALEPNIVARIAAADNISASEYVRRRTAIQNWSAAAAAALDGVDALLSPTVAATPPTLAELEPEGAYPRINMLALRNTAVINFMGLCAVTLPVGRDALGMPVGLQLIGKPWAEPRLLAVARAAEDLIGTTRHILGHPPLPLELETT